MAAPQRSDDLYSLAQQANYGLVVTRDVDSSHQYRAMSMWLVPMDLPGITIHGLQKVGWHNPDFNEVFDNVEIFPSMLVGQEKTASFSCARLYR